MADRKVWLITCAARGMGESFVRATRAAYRDLSSSLTHND